MENDLFGVGTLMKWLLPIILFLLVGGFFNFKRLKLNSLWRAGAIESRLELQRALKDIQETGGLRDYGNTLRPFVFTNSVVVGGTNYRCAVAYESPKFYGDGFMAATTNHVFFYVDKKRGARVISE